MRKVKRAITIDFTDGGSASFRVVDHAYGIAVVEPRLVPSSRRETERVAAAAIGFLRYLRLRIPSLGVSVTRAPMHPCCYVSEAHDVVLAVSFSVDWEHDVRHALMRAADIVLRDYPCIHPGSISPCLDTLWAASVDGRIFHAGFRNAEGAEQKFRRHVDALRAVAGTLTSSEALALVQRAWGAEVSWAALVALSRIDEVFEQKNPASAATTVLQV